MVACDMLSLRLGFYSILCHICIMTNWFISTSCGKFLKTHHFDIIFLSQKKNKTKSNCTWRRDLVTTFLIYEWSERWMGHKYPKSNHLLFFFIFSGIFQPKFTLYQAVNFACTHRCKYVYRRQAIQIWIIKVINFIDGKG